MPIRFVLYGLLGWAIEIVWTALGSTVGGAQRSWRLAGTTYLWMFPIYGLLATASPRAARAHSSPSAAASRSNLAAVGSLSISIGQSVMIS